MVVILALIRKMIWQGKKTTEVNSQEVLKLI